MMIDIYTNWDVFVSNMDIVPIELDADKLLAMASDLYCSRNERVRLGEKAAGGDKVALESFLKAYVPMIISVMKKYAPRIGYNRDVLMNCVEKLREKVLNSLYIDNLEYDTSHYVSWMARNEVTRYIASKEKTKLTTQNEQVKEEQKSDVLQEMIKEIRETISDKNLAAMIEIMLLVCDNDRDRQLLTYRIGLKDGKSKTLQETAEKFGISKERARQIENKVLRRMVSHVRRKQHLADFLNDE